MKILSLLVLSLMPLWATAQQYKEMDEQQMQAMMENAKKMEVCMENIDQGEIKVLEQQAKQMESEVKALCAAGKRTEAQDKAMVFGKKATSNAAMQEMAKCGEMMKGYMPEIPGMAKTDKGDVSNYHICDY